MPDFSLEDEYAPDTLVCGLDEVGRGPLAGPVVAACVHIPPDVRSMDFMAAVRDSKKLSFPKLEALYQGITRHCVWGVAEIGPREIDEINILQASLKAMERAFLSMLSSRAQSRDPIYPGSAQIPPLPPVGRDDFSALVDGNKLPALPCPARAVVKGDAKSKSIAAASIVAKVTRDQIMRDLALEYPHYGWERNVGYPVRVHLAGIDAHGITAHHRRSFAPVRKFLECGATRKAPSKAA